MLNIHKLSVSFQGDYLFENISFRLRGGDRVGLIGKNGAGKSTLLKLLSGELEYTEGQVAQEKKDLKIGFLKQDIDFVVGRTILEEAYQAFEEIKKAVVRKIGDAMSSGKYKDAPIVISKNKYVIDGHHRWAARKKYAPTKKIRALVVHKKAMDVLGIAAAEGQPREAF